MEHFLKTVILIKREGVIDVEQDNEVEHNFVGERGGSYQ